MNKQRILIIAVVVLIIMNIATLSFLWFSKPNERHHRRMRKEPDVERYLIHKLDLSKEQAKVFKTARKKHFEKTQSVLRSLHSDRQRLTQMLSDIDTTNRDGLLNEISVKRMEVEKLNFIHLQTLRAVCTDEQKQKFDSIIFKVIDKGAGFRKGMKLRKKRK